MAVRIQMRRDTFANWQANNPTLAEGEMGIELDTHRWKFGYQNLPWNSLPYSNSLYAGPSEINGDDSNVSLTITQAGSGDALKVQDSTDPDSTPFIVKGNGDVGIGTPSPAAKLDVVGDIRLSGQLTSTIATGSAPFVVSSTTKVDNLNADLLDGQSGDYYTTAGNLTGTIPSGVLGNSNVYVGTTSIALNRSSSSQSLTGVSIDGNAATVTNGVYTTGSYSNPSWLTGVAWSKISSTPTTISGYGITDAVATGSTYSNPSWLTGLAWSKISSTPTTLSGYGITDALDTSSTSQTKNGNLTIVGTLTATDVVLTGSGTTITTTNLSVTDSLIYLSDEQFDSDSIDIGIYGAYGDVNPGHYHTGLVRDASDSGKWKLISGAPEPVSNVVDFTGVTYDTLKIGALEVTSTSVVTNLNADKLDGQDGSYYNTAGNLTGTIPSTVLGNSSHYIGTTSIALNRASASQTLTGVSIDGNAGTVTNGVYTSGSYSNPSWITGLAWSKISSTPTTLSGYGITDAVSNTSVISAAYGGTGQSSYSAGDILYAGASTVLNKLAAVATGNALISGGVNSAPSWGKIGLTTHVSGTLAVANGGTGSTTSTGSGSVVLATSPSISGGTISNATSITLTGAQTLASYRVRNIYVSTTDPGTGSEGDIWLKY